MKKIISCFFIHFISILPTFVWAADIKTPTGYETEAVIDNDGGEKSVAIVLLHGKSSRPDASHLEEFRSDMENKGYRIVNPVMTWSDEKRTGTFDQSLEIIEDSVKLAAKGGKKVVVAGHSMGATFALIYAAGATNPAVVGILALAPGHMPTIPKKLQRVTASSVAQAREMMLNGQGKEELDVVDFNKGQKEKFTTTAEYYATHYDPETFPDIYNVLSKVQLPVLWISGANDRLTHIFDYEDMFANHQHPKSVYKELDGKHISVVPNSVDEVDAWVAIL
jgi:pimeloyl-ACP methyl ester carboxylesterase